MTQVQPLGFQSSPNLENEIKLGLPNPAEARQKLFDLRATSLGIESQRDTYFQRPNLGDRIKGENIRVRQVTNQDKVYGYLAYKSPLDPTAQFLKREEFETRIDDPRMLLVILQRLGYEIIDEIAKTREGYRLDGMHIGLDHVEALGDFIEIEGLDEDITSLARKLSLDPTKAINKSYSVLRDEQRRKK